MRNTGTMESANARAIGDRGSPAIMARETREKLEQLATIANGLVIELETRMFGNMPRETADVPAPNHPRDFIAANLAGAERAALDIDQALQRLSKVISRIGHTAGETFEAMPAGGGSGGSYSSPISTTALPNASTRGY